MNRDPAPPAGLGIALRDRGNHPVRAMNYLEFRIRSDHPPTAPRTTQDPPLTGVTRSCLGDVKLPEKNSPSGSPEETIQSCPDCGPRHLVFAMSGCTGKAKSAYWGI